MTPTAEVTLTVSTTPDPAPGGVPHFTQERIAMPNLSPLTAGTPTASVEADISYKATANYCTLTVRVSTTLPCTVGDACEGVAHEAALALSTQYADKALDDLTPGFVQWATGGEG